MKIKVIVLVMFLSVFVALMMLVRFNQGKALQQQPLEIARVNGYQIMMDEFEEGFQASAFAARADKLQARREYLGTLINQKLVLLDAQEKNLDKEPDFLKSVERFWAQSLLTIALGRKTMELHRGMNVRDEDIRRIYENMVKEGITTKPISDVYPQIKWQAEKQLEAQLLNHWIDGLRQKAVVSIDENRLKALE